MAGERINDLRTAIIRVLKYQIIQGVIASLLVLIIAQGRGLAFLSAASGGAIALIPTCIYGWIVIPRGRYSQRSQAEIARSQRIPRVDDYGTMYRKHKKAVLLKFISNMLGFFFVFLLFKQINVLALFIGYVATLSAYWTSLIKL